MLKRILSVVLALTMTGLMTMSAAAYGKSVSNNNMQGKVQQYQPLQENPQIRDVVASEDNLDVAGTNTLEEKSAQRGPDTMTPEEKAKWTGSGISTDSDTASNDADKDGNPNRFEATTTPLVQSGPSLTEGSAEQIEVAEFKEVDVSAVESLRVALMYHKLSTDEKDRNAFCISPEEFEEDIIYLKKMGFEFCTPSDVKNADFAYIKKCVFITFDDGYESDYELALPILEKHGAKATFFVIGSQVGREDYMSGEQLALLAQSDNVEIGNHTFELHNKTPEEITALYSGENLTAVVDDYAKNINFLQNITGKRVSSISCPYGIWNTTLSEILKAKGNFSIFTSEESFIEVLDMPFGRLNRSEDRTPDQLIQMIFRRKHEASLREKETGDNVEKEKDVIIKEEPADKPVEEVKPSTEKSPQSSWLDYFLNSSSRDEKVSSAPAEQTPETPDFSFMPQKSVSKKGSK